jgi:phage/conjugal plasmid C-4 type zinc finger TraR family protein
MSDWIDKSVTDQEAALSRSLEAARTKHSTKPQLIINGVIVCLFCTEAIPLARLKALPDATHCTECQTMLEEQ